MRTPKRQRKLSEAVEGFILFRRAEGISPSTIKIYEWTFRHLSEFLKGEDPVLSSLHKEDIQRFYLWLQTEYKPSRKNRDTSRLTPSSIEKVWSTLRSFYHWAVEELGVDRADTLIKRPKYKPREIAPFTEDEVRLLLKHCATTREAYTKSRTSFIMRRPTAHRDVAIILLLLDTGLRVSECARLKVKDVNTNTGEVFVDAFGTGQKTKSRHVYLGKKALKALWRYLADREDLRDTDPLFLSQTDVPMNKNSIRLMLNELGARAGVRGVHPHRFRHTFAIQYLRNHGDIFTLQRLLGHSTLAMVQHYLSIAAADVQETHCQASPADRWHI